MAINCVHIQRERRGPDLKVRWVRRRGPAHSTRNPDTVLDPTIVKVWLVARLARGDYLVTFEPRARSDQFCATSLA